jgi:hypothetical protein
VQLARLVQGAKNVAVAAPLLYSFHNDAVVDAGYIVSDAYGTVPLFRGLPVQIHTYFGNAAWVRAVDGFEGKVLCMRTDTARGYPAFHNVLAGNVADRSAFYEQLKRGGSDVVLWAHSRVAYEGELCAVQHTASVHFNPAVDLSAVIFGLPKGARIESYDKDAA